MSKDERLDEEETPFDHPAVMGGYPLSTEEKELVRHAAEGEKAIEDE